MLFNSLQFAVFFPLVTLGFYAVRPAWRWLWLLVASAYFYMCFVPAYILILAFTIGFDYVAGTVIERAKGRLRTLFLVGSLVVNVGVLGFFKYYNFAAASTDALFGWLGVGHPWPRLDLVLPISLSFHTFQSMSYTIEVYRGKQPAERHLGIFALYVMFYPQLVAGPIERPQNLLPQFHATQVFSYEGVTGGLKLMAWGFFKKLVIADRIGLMVGAVYDAPGKASGVALALATVLFAYQIYCDFSGYTDIARGCAEVMGFRLMRNFDSPYASASIAEFWRRWHISLSTWFRDYLYFPLGGSRRGTARTCLNLIVVFLVSGLWHGANWTFVVWGGIHGALVAGQHLWESAVGKGATRPNAWLHNAKVVLTFATVCFTWIFFRAASLADATLIIRRIAADLPSLVRPARVVEAIAQVSSGSGIGRLAFFIVVAAIVMLEIVQRLQRRTPVRTWLAGRPAVVSWGLYATAVAVLLVFSQTNRPSAFIYFQF